ncbi:MAG: methyltetrahydrofolate cobalamin methyltransferase, partial [Gammaproteobacteria bacterium]|nr:methyltetrahydrofolate cobalamin methyltransferase [Gammaproteobacteria bacterium]
SNVVVDPLVMPVGAINTAGKQVFQIIHRLRTELKVNSSCGASNISFGLPNRNGLNAAYLSMGIAAGMTSAIMNPLHEVEMQGVLGADVMMGHDPDCTRWIRRFRDPATATTESSERGRRGGRRRRAQASA